MLRRGKGTDQNDIYQKRNSISECTLYFFIVDHNVLGVLK